ncbi:MAG: hypothetical protein AABZ39_05615 [Spirochaetota bacterium]
MKKAISSAVIAAAILGMFGCAKPRDVKGLESGLPNDAGKVKGDFGMELVEGVVCAGVEKRAPITPGTSYAPGADGTAKVFFFTRIASEGVTNVVYHRYSYYVPTLSGRGIWKESHVTELSVTKSTNYPTYSWALSSPGLWRVDALGADRKSIMKGFVFEVAGAAKEVKNPLAGTDSKAIVSVVDAAICENVDKHAAVNPGTEFTAAEEPKRIWFWGKFKAPSAPAKAVIRWSKLTESIDGDKDFVTTYYSQVEIKSKEWTTYYWINCTAGEWKADVLAADESIVRSIEFTVSKQQ